ncbi:MAG: ABC transporter substrate-binding protein [Gammaproteobacteria bacterium]|nr:MAG: ABC transporter substrate-binding protein [Gammaproteobacteria bacterium]
MLLPAIAFAQEDPQLPADLVWETNNTAPTFADPNAKKGGTFRTFVVSFPLTLRTVGPNSNSSFRGYILGNQFGLVGMHPETEEIIPEMATHWAYGKDGKTVYYKLDPQARWSDGKPVTADDYLFTIEFMRSKHIVAPWYNNHYSKMIVNVVKYDDYTISVEGAIAKPKKDLHISYGLGPTPRHFHKLDEKWVENYNWKITPNTGPYQISKIKKGKVIEFKRKKDWWAANKRYFKNRYNVDKVRVKVIRDVNVAFKHFEKGEVDTFGLNLPPYWHEKAKGKIYDRGYIHKAWFYNETRQPSHGMYLNLQNEILKDKNVRLGLAHATNVEKTISTVLRNDYERLHSGYIGYGKYTNKNVRAREFDLQKAGEYLAAAGWDKRGDDGIRIKDGKRLSLLITYTLKEYNDRLVVIKEEAKKAGIELKLQWLDPSAGFKNVLEKKHQIAWMGWSTGFRPAFWQHYHSDNANKPQTNNITNTDNKELDALIMQYREEINEEKRIELAHKLQQYVHDEASYIPTYSQPYARSGYWRWMQLPKHLGTKTSGSLFDLFSSSTGGLFWIDENMKKETLRAKKKGKRFEPVLIKDTRYKSK